MEAASSLDSFSTVTTRSAKLKQQQQNILTTMKKSISNNDITNSEFYSNNNRKRLSVSNDNSSDNEQSSSNSDVEQLKPTEEEILKSKSLSFAHEIDNINLYVILSKKKNEIYILFLILFLLL